MHGCVKIADAAVGEQSAQLGLRHPFEPSVTGPMSQGSGRKYASILRAGGVNYTVHHICGAA